ncbi:MAG TPA: bifunctional 4-hydroxy-2-oxoglutarate aldolase/2-dehydro-3-deoxy-phosphogluconate aldolase [Pseudolysinimonas sp.]|nr:bifunctional 4-hydroxy-2-oxoglutarate aldolase/2-dehydro-3-deoxy-phosphogluconate aldolase [Pseudolysinimonas sp.]
MTLQTAGPADVVVRRLATARVLPVVTLDDPDLAVPLARALLDGGVDVIEIALRTEGALESIARIDREVPEMLVGAGTVLTAAQLDLAVAAGSRFALAPGLSSAVVRRAAVDGVPFFPGVATPSDVMRALELGCTVLKVFPASTLGATGIAQLAAPFASHRVGWIPTGGIGGSDAPGYAAIPGVVCVGGSWMVAPAAIGRADWGRIAALAKAAQSAVASQNS